uniref:Peroxidase n=1 Tax=Plectus sambesii TaxID=2011161 RepID=A0A914UMF8_9BILA
MAAFGPILVVFVALCGISIGQGDENRLHPHHAERELPSPHGRYPMRGSPQTLHGRNREPTETAKKLDLGSRKSLEATRHALDGKVGSDRAFLIAHMTDDDEDVVEVPTDSCDERNFPCALGHRRYSGWCNNMQNPRFGASHSLYQRLLPPAYDDDVNSPRSVGVSGRLLPSPRKITTTVFGLASHESNERTIWMMQWGQFLDHDISRTPNSVETDGSFPKCPDCSTTANPLCLPIIIPANDPHFPPSRGCMNFVRSSNGRLSLGRREQISIISAYIDASQVYGSDDCVASSLRAEDDGLLKTSDDGKMLPKSPDNGFCRSDSIDCFLAGDIRVNENIALTSVQTLWLLEHNRIATELKGINPSWDDETLYQETRKIIIAMHQHINYKEYIPKVIGPDLTDE